MSTLLIAVISGLVQLGILGIFVLAASLFWLWALALCLTDKHASDTDKVLWFVVVFLLHCVGAMLYVLVRKGKRGPS